MKKILILGLVILLALGMLACFSPELENVNNEGSDIDAVIDEGDNGSNPEPRKVNVSFNLPYEYYKNDDIALLFIIGGTQEIEWFVDENYQYVNIYLYQDEVFVEILEENYPNEDGFYSWDIPTETRQEHNYQLAIYPHNSDVIPTVDEIYSLSGLSPEFSLSQSAFDNAFTIVNTLHEDASQEEKEAFLVGYFKYFQNEIIEFMGEERVGKGDVDDPGEEIPDWIINNPYYFWLYQQMEQLADDANGDVEVFLLSLRYMHVYSEAARDILILILGDWFGFTDIVDEIDGEIRLDNPLTGEIIYIVWEENGTVRIRYVDLRILREVLIEWVVLEDNGDTIKIVRYVYIDDNLEEISYEDYKIVDGYLEPFS